MMRKMKMRGRGRSEAHYCGDSLWKVICHLVHFKKKKKKEERNKKKRRERRKLGATKMAQRVRELATSLAL